MSVESQIAELREDIRQIHGVLLELQRSHGRVLGLVAAGSVGLSLVTSLLVAILSG